MSNTQLLITSAGELIQNGSTGDPVVSFLAESSSVGSVLDKFNKVNACFKFDDRQTITVPLIFVNDESQPINIADICKSVFTKVSIYVDLIDDTTADEDLYEYLVTNTVVLSFYGKTLSDYGIVDAYTKDEINTMIGDIESLLEQV